MPEFSKIERAAKVPAVGSYRLAPPVLAGEVEDDAILHNWDTFPAATVYSNCVVLLCVWDYYNYQEKD